MFLYDGKVKLVGFSRTKFKKIPISFHKRREKQNTIKEKREFLRKIDFRLPMSQFFLQPFKVQFSITIYQI